MYINLDSGIGIDILIYIDVHIYVDFNFDTYINIITDIFENHISNKKFTSFIYQQYAKN